MICPFGSSAVATHCDVADTIGSNRTFVQTPPSMPTFWPWLKRSPVLSARCRL